MSRFRAKQKHDGKWVEGSLWESERFGDGIAKINVEDGDDIISDTGWVEVDAESVRMLQPKNPYAAPTFKSDLACTCYKPDPFKLMPDKCFKCHGKISNA